MQPAPHTPNDQAPTGREMLWEILELSGGFAAMLMPLMLLAVPGIVLFIVAPAALILLVVAIPAALAAATVALPYMLIRAVRR